MIITLNYKGVKRKPTGNRVLLVFDAQSENQRTALTLTSRGARLFVATQK